MAQHHRAGEGRSGDRTGRSLVRMHAVNIFTDVLGQRDTGRGGEIEASMRYIAKEGRGVVVLIREPPTVMLSEHRRRAGERIKPAGGELRDYGVGAQILIDLGVKEMVLLTNSRKSVVGLEGFGLKIVGQKPVPADVCLTMSTRTETRDGAASCRRRQGGAHPDRGVALLRRDRRCADRGRRARDREERRARPNGLSCPAPSRFRAPSRLAAERYDGFVALGCVMRGETTHYDYICGESARGLMELAVNRKLAIGYGILTVETIEQAKARALVERGDKGGDAAHACLTMVALGRRWRPG